MSTSIRPRNGHARDHLREAMCDAIHDLCHQPLGHPEPKVELDGRQLTMTQLCGLLWACTDQLPGYEVELLRAMDLDPGRCTYAAAARKLVPYIARKPIRAARMAITAGAEAV